MGGSSHLSAQSIMSLVPRCSRLATAAAVFVSAASGVETGGSSSNSSSTGAPCCACRRTASIESMNQHPDTGADIQFPRGFGPLLSQPFEDRSMTDAQTIGRSMFIRDFMELQRQSGVTPDGRFRFAPGKRCSNVIPFVNSKLKRRRRSKFVPKDEELDAEPPAPSPLDQRTEPPPPPVYDDYDPFFLLERRPELDMWSPAEEFAAKLQRDSDIAAYRDRLLETEEELDVDHNAAHDFAYQNAIAENSRRDFDLVRLSSYDADVTRFLRSFKADFDPVSPTREEDGLQLTGAVPVESVEEWEERVSGGGNEKFFPVGGFAEPWTKDIWYEALEWCADERNKCSGIMQYTGDPGPNCITWCGQPQFCSSEKTGTDEDTSADLEDSADWDLWYSPVAPWAKQIQGRGLVSPE